tara:strand:+ start:392 stop:1414 length:1023 start_codon:yes stop_codon:yes gene_type:complete
MATLTKPLVAVMNALTIVASIFTKGFSAVQKIFSRGDFLPVEWVKIKDLKIDPKYQRLINVNFIKKAGEFDPLLVKPLSVFQRPNGDLMIVDGQHTTVLAGTYVKDAANFELPCQIQVHPADFTIAQCEKAEAVYFKRFNFLRNTVSAVAKLRSDIAQGAKYALDIEESFQSLNVQVEGIGAPDDGTNSVRGYAKLKVAITKYGNTFTKTAVDLYKVHNKKKGNSWNAPLNGGMILGLAATYHFIDNYVGDSKKREGFLYYLNELLPNITVADYIAKTSGPQMDILIVENIIDNYNILCKMKALNYPSIGMEKDNSLWKKWKEDPIHGRSKDSEDDEEES